ncbi:MULTISPECIES: DUF1310 family protein [Enterococcus]|uniref:DUF1310 domain-containing protein n=1 Tax=Enterococcus mundtii TaxID=53346 RepID=A0A2M9FNZ7_ENTMU|nr:MULTISPECIES: DUF1310 family protein [Enterococcus]MBE9910806.1 DUF1310 domain-containing protein [Enterococcus mundtii]MRI74538.1 DUF1310 family protein [Enterococcus mundtii]NMP57226.1 DUF1310 domain-containing protein [Enterococcus mundtii]PJK25169.1 DUF1310 domain-containing protein [Enterococcus mundtii]GKS54336.1 hypothetical protein EMLAB_09510 [Enterococcus mundtii]
MKRKPIKKRQIVLIITGICLLWIGGTMYMDHLKLEEEMIRVVNSEEAKIVLEKTLKNLDSKALTSEGVIKNYKIDYKNIKRNPMGGISVPLIINDNNKLLVFNLLDRNQINGELSKLKNDIVRTTSDLYELLKEGGEDSEEY